MNLTRALDSALPDLPPQRYRETFFRFNPGTFTREDKSPTHTTIMAITKTHKVMAFTPEQWKLVQMFDGRRTYEQLSVLWRKACNVSCPPEHIRQYAEALDRADFWFKTPQEESAALMTELMQDRQQVVRRKEPVSISRIYVAVCDADRQVSAVYRWVRGMYNPKFVIPTLAAVALMLCLWISRWEMIFSDSVQYWAMSEKTGRDLLEFYFIFLIVGFLHESGHALTAKHFGAGVHRTGLMLVYTVPAFFVNLGEVWVYGGRLARICAILGGFWFEAMLCCMATLVWWGTAVGTTAHDLAYKFILVGGIMPVMFNLNPLVPLDGYLCLCEIIRIQGLKEKATHFLSSFVQKHVFRLPVIVPVLPRRRALFFAIFAFLSGVYTYSMTLFLARVTYRVVHNYSPQWAFLPAALIALRMFKSRIEKFATFCKTLYLDKRELMQAHRKQLIFAAVLVAIFALLPLWHESVQAPFLLEAAHHAVLRAEVPGRVRQVFVGEGDSVKAGAPLLRMENADVTAANTRALAAFEVAGARGREAQLRYADTGATQSQLQARAQQAQFTEEQQAKLSMDAPFPATVVTPRLRDLKGTYVEVGTPLVELADESVLRARIFVVEGDLDALPEITGHALYVPGRMAALHGEFQGISPADQQVPAGVLPPTKIQGLLPPPHFVATVLLPNRDGKLRSGMVGEAKIFGERRTLVGLIARPVIEFLARKLW